MELSNLIQGAQDAMERGDYRLAIAATNHALGRYPNCLAAHRMLGEAYLERADQQQAIAHFERALAVDPLNVVSRLGMGVAAEETRDYQAAYAHYLHAWELNPALDQVRDELVRIRGLLNVEDRLHPTRAGLAGIHSRSGQFYRAIAEWRAVLAVEPDSRRARTSIAELLWRQGDDHQASLAARDALRGCPENARALALLAELERRRGGSNADEFVQRYRAADPTGDVVAILAPWRSDVDLSFLNSDQQPIPEFDFAANASRDTGPLGGRRVVTASLAASQIAAPDLWDTLVKDLSLEIPATSIAPTLASGGDSEHRTAPLVAANVPDAKPAEDLETAFFGPDDLNIPGAEPFVHEDVQVPTVEAEPAFERNLEFVMSSTTDEEIASAVPSAATMGTIELSNSEEAGFAELMATMNGTSVTDTLSTSRSLEQTGDLAAIGTNNNALASSGDVYGATVPFTMDPLMGTVEPLRSAPDESAMAALFGDQGTNSADQTPPSAPVTDKPYVDPFVTADGKIDLTSGWDDLDRQLAEATPGLSPDAAFDDLLAELNVDGIEPFAAESKTIDEDAWAPFSADDFAPEAPPASVKEQIEPFFIADTVANASEPPLAMEDLLALEPASQIEPFLVPGIVEGIPAERNSGYTEILRNIDDESPFEALLDADIEPFEVPDASGTPLQFEELLEVTSTDGTGPLVFEPQDADAGDSFDFAQVMESASDPGIADDIIPFAFGATEFDSPGDLPDLESVNPYDSGQTDLEAALSSEPVNPFDFADTPSEAATPAETISPLNLADTELESAHPSEPVNPFDFADTDLEAAMPPVFDDPLGLQLDGIEPFDSNSFDVIGDASGSTYGGYDYGNAGQTAPPSPPPVYGSEQSGQSSSFMSGSIAPHPVEPEQVETFGDEFSPFAFEDSQSGEDQLSPFDFDELNNQEPQLPMATEALSTDEETEFPEFEEAATYTNVLRSLEVSVADAEAAIQLESGPEPGWAGREGLGAVARKILWPQFVNQTSELIDRALETENLFERISQQKDALLEMGVIAVDRQMERPRIAEAEVVPATEAAAVIDEPVIREVVSVPVTPNMSDQTRMDLMAMRARLTEDEDSAGEIAGALEQAMSEGLRAPLAQRVLGEAYLKLGYVERAAAQFRQAMLARRRSG